MKNLRSLLERFSRSLNKDTHTKEAIASVIKDRIGAAIPLDNFSLKEGVLTVNAGATVKNEISLKEESIRAELKERYQISVNRILYK